MHSGPKQFKDWMERRGFKKQQDAAKFFGWYESVISQYLTGQRRPKLANALIIEEKTGIPPKAWLSTDDDDSDAGAAANVAKSHVHKA